jgi:hypothetical protein
MVACSVILGMVVVILTCSLRRSSMEFLMPFETDEKEYFHLFKSFKRHDLVKKIFSIFRRLEEQSFFSHLRRQLAAVKPPTTHEDHGMLFMMMTPVFTTMPMMFMTTSLLLMAVVTLIVIKGPNMILLNFREHESDLLFLCRRFGLFAHAVTQVLPLLLRVYFFVGMCVLYLFHFLYFGIIIFLATIAHSTLT